MPLSHPILAIDHGAARIGLAITDPIGILASPLETVSNDEQTFNRINELIAQHRVQGIVLGLPLRMDGSEGKATLKIRHFANKLRKSMARQIDIEFVDERMTTIAATEKLQQAGKKTKQHKDIIDQAAAVEILNIYMQALDNPFGLLEDPDSF